MGSQEANENSKLRESGSQGRKTVCRGNGNRGKELVMGLGKADKGVNNWEECIWMGRNCL